MKKRLFIGIILLITICALSCMFTGCSSKSDNKANTDEIDPKNVLESVRPPEDFVLEGSWSDESSGRAAMDITKGKGEDEYEVLITWANGAAEKVSWKFSGTFDREGGFLSYEDCVKTTITFDENDNDTAKTEYENGKGAISYLDGKLRWEDKQEDAGKDCNFVKVD